MPETIFFNAWVRSIWLKRQLFGGRAPGFASVLLPCLDFGRIGSAYPVHAFFRVFGLLDSRPSIAGFG